MESNGGERVRRRVKIKPLTSTKRPGYSIVHHRRAFDPPLSCKMGAHKGLITKMMDGIPSLYCTKCGQYLYKHIVEKTYSRRDLEFIEKAKDEEVRIKSRKEMLEDSWKKLEALRKKNSDRSIRKFVKQRMGRL